MEREYLNIPSDRHFIHGAIFLLANAIQTAGDQVTREVTSKQWFLLMMLGQVPHEPTISGAAALVGSSRQNVAKMLGPLEKKGLVQLVPQPGDARAHCVRLTPKARELLAEVSQKGHGFIASLFAGVSDEEVACVKAVFEKLADNLQAMQRENKETENDGTAKA